MRRILTALCLALPLPAGAQDAADLVRDAVDHHILPGYERLASETAELAETAAADCDPSSEALRAAYGEAFDAWVSVSHLRFGPAETDSRAFGLAFWPDPRGSTPGALSGLIAEADPVVEDTDAFATVSVAARGFYALEFLLYDDAFAELGEPAYRCSLIQAVATDAAITAAAILEDWETGYADLMREPGNDTYRTEVESLRALFNALTTGLEFTADVRLGRPLGTFERPRPARAEARRSGRSLRHVEVSLEALRDLTARMTPAVPELGQRFELRFDEALGQAARIEAPDFSGVANPSTRIRIEALQADVHAIDLLARTDLGPTLGVAAGFNALDGD